MKKSDFTERIEEVDSFDWIGTASFSLFSSIGDSNRERRREDPEEHEEKMFVT